ncbi:MAG: PTS sugar transporter subunit IIA [Acidobacteriota bacterium]
MKITDYLREDLIDANLKPRDKVDCLRQMIAVLVRAKAILNPEDSLARLLEREKVVSTGIGNGVGIPHAKAADVSRMVVAVARVEGGFDFEALDGRPVHILFLLLGPPQQAGLHVKLLARIARLIKHPGFLERLKQADTAKKLYQVIQNEDQRNP